jgi:hypothetical protein
MVATKGGIGGPGRGRPEVLRAELEQSLRRLRTDSIDLYYLHRVDPETAIEESLAAIKEYRDRSKVRHVGISEVDVGQIERARRVVPIAAVQNHYNISERRYEQVVDYCTREGIVFVPFFPLRIHGGAVLDEIARRRGATPRQITPATAVTRDAIVSAASTAKTLSKRMAPPFVKAVRVWSQSTARFRMKAPMTKRLSHSRPMPTQLPGEPITMSVTIPWPGSRELTPRRGARDDLLTVVVRGQH